MTMQGRIGLGRRRFASERQRERGALSTARCLALLLLLGACKPPPDARHDMPTASADRGLAAIGRVGCASCHAIPGIEWPEGRIGPPLAGFAQKELIDGHLPNRPDLLARFVRDAPSLSPEGTMPAMPLTRQESRDVAAYLYTLDAH